MKRKARFNPVSCIYWGVLLAVRVFYYICLGIGSTTNDTASFVDWSISSCQRTPGYPLLIDVFQLLMGEEYYRGVFLFQAAVSYFSLFFLFRCIYMLLNRNADRKSEIISGIDKGSAAAYVLVFLYGCCPVTAGWDTYILAESLAVSVTVFFLYYSIRFIYSFDIRYGIAAVIVSFAATAVKTALFVYTIDLFILFILILLFDRRRLGMGEWIKLFAVMGAVSVLYIVWMSIIYHYTGVFSFAIYSVKHGVIKTLQTGLFMNYHDPETVAEIKSIIVENNCKISNWSVVWPIFELFDNMAGVNSFARECLRSDPAGYFAYQMRLIFSTGDEVFWLYYPPAGAVRVIQAAYDSFLTVRTVCCTAAVTGLLLVIRWIADRKIPYDLCGFFGGSVSIIVSVYWGSYSAWGRLLVFILPFFVCSVSLIIREGYLCFKSITHKYRNS